MRRLLFFLYLLFLFTSFLNAQQVIDSIQQLDEVIISSQRISIPFSKLSHSIHLIDSLIINKSTATSLDEILQNVPGVDVRRRGIKGMQSDLYIRGGNFNQTLVLIDGVKMDDLQSGHHSMNAVIPLENIERVEVIKGAASRIYGQNAMNGAINIVTKKITSNISKISINAGSFENYGLSFFAQRNYKEIGFQLHVDKQQAMGYRYNTDFDNWYASAKLQWNDFTLLNTFSKRKFGANGFYASPDYKDQYEETQTNLLAINKNFSWNNWRIKPKVYWRQNQDMYVFIRDNPDFYRNFHKNDKIGLSVDAVLSTDYGKTGLGIDFNKGFLLSNNLGNRNRNSLLLFAEHRFQNGKETWNITPGIALAYYSDFKFFYYPGINMGLSITDSFRIYMDSGYTYRIPTYTNLYYNSRIEEGNPDLLPEKAFTTEIGLHASFENIDLQSAFFYRESKDLIDWVKYSKEDKWHAENLGNINTGGWEVELNYIFSLVELKNKFSVAYTFLEENKQLEIQEISRYHLNSFRHQLNTQVNTEITKHISQTLSYRFVDRMYSANYSIFDAAWKIQINKMLFSLKFNNILNVDYSETNLVPMPGRNFMTEFSYSF